MSQHAPISLHESVDNATGSGDQRLLYGIGVPFLVMTGVIIAYVLNPTWYFLVLLMLAVIAVGGGVIWGLLQMLDEEENEAP
jgi:hypothetical protein